MTGARAHGARGGCLLCIVLLGAIGAAQEPRPAALFEWPGSCASDCCGYGAAWKAREDTVTLASPRRASAASPHVASAFPIRAGELVRAITGTLYTIAPGTARVDEDFSTDATYKDFSTRHKRPLTFLAGETITLLAPRGGGVYRIQDDTGVFDANLFRIGTLESCTEPNARCAGVITRPPVFEWWVMVLNAEQRAGWIDDPSRFVRGSCK
jgi:hypothetical protein